jgi:exonuclease SbcC
VLAGQSLIVKGPPGTGKSQTIANLIASLVARNRKVLFVAEKRAAIDAVTKRLNQKKLGDLLLDLHGGVSSRRAFAQAIGEALAASRVAARIELEEAIVVDRQLRTLYNALATDLRADHFLAWILEESMNQLAGQASIELLRISDDRYSLVADAGNFDVVDHNNADERRSVATLSGGETFLASLSLALALAAGLRELASTGASRLDAVFIDEGFGALDPETLGVVVDALERLQQGDRMVGVITHVPDLAERIPMGLLVEKSGPSSRILAR